MCHISECQIFPDSRFKMENCIEMDSLTPPEVEGYQAPKGDNDNSLAQPEKTYRKITLQKHKKKSGRQTDGQTDR